MNSMVRTLLIFGALVFICLVMIFVVRPAVSKSRTLSPLDQTGRSRYEQWATKPLGINPADLDVTPASAAFEEEKKRFFEEWNNVAVTVNTHQKTLNQLAERKLIVSTDDVAFLAELEPFVQQVSRLVNHPDYTLEDLGLYNVQSEAAKQTLPVIQFTRTILLVRGLNGIAKQQPNVYGSSAELLLKLAHNPAYSTAFVDALSWSILERASSLGTIIKKQPAPNTVWADLRPQFEAAIAALKKTESIDATAVDHAGMVRMMVKTGELKALPQITSETTGEELFQHATQKQGVTSLQAASGYVVVYPAMEELTSQRESLLRALEYLVS